METVFDIVIIGGGIIGVATAYNLQVTYPKLKILLLEKEMEFAVHQTGHNSGVIHSGLYYKPGSKKAEYCVKGRQKLIEFAKNNNISYELCGKVVVATEASELPFMNKIFENGLANNTDGIEKITADEVRDLEPFVECVAGIHVPSTGIVDYVAITMKMIDLIKDINNNSKLLTGQNVVSFDHGNGYRNIHTKKEHFKAKKMIFCGGLQADRLAKLDNVALKEKIVGFRGDYFELTPQAKHKVKGLIYPVPDPKFPFLGVHFTKMINGEVECGPNAVFSFKREGYNKTDFNFKDTFDALTYSGTWRLFMANFSFGINEYRRAFSKQLYLKTLQRMIPSLTIDDLKPAKSGVRAQLLNERGSTKDDFRFEFTDDSIHVLNAPSPAATACLQIGEEVRIIAEKYFSLENILTEDA
ncbi:MAG: L-2-hydroxyglutarate oxidase [Pseudomonadota bacterium]